MLPEGSRVRSRTDHARVGRSGRRTRSGPLVIHTLSTGADEPARVGFVVSRRVGNAVVRNRVRRRLREQTRHRLAALPAGTLMLVRALPEAAGATSGDLARALDQALKRALPVTRGTPAAERHRRPDAAAAEPAEPGRYLP